MITVTEELPMKSEYILPNATHALPVPTLAVPTLPALTLLVLTLVAFTLTTPAFGEDWAQWRGPNRDAKSLETGLLEKWPEEGPPLAWKATGIGGGYSSIAIANGHIFTMGDLDDGSYVLVLNEADGALIWKTRIGEAGGHRSGTRGHAARQLSMAMKSLSSTNMQTLCALMQRPATQTGR